MVLAALATVPPAVLAALRAPLATRSPAEVAEAAAVFDAAAAACTPFDAPAAVKAAAAAEVLVRRCSRLFGSAAMGR